MGKRRIPKPEDVLNQQSSPERKIPTPGEVLEQPTEEKKKELSKQAPHKSSFVGPLELG